MVYSASDIQHLDLMKSLEDLTSPLPDEIIISNAISFDESVLKLCEGLRQEGLDKQADLVENKFMAYKVAAKTHLYRVHDHTGEDLIHEAHPDADPNMGDGDLGDVEGILSRHKKIVDIVNKTPTGKLAAYVEQCKIALGQQVGISAKALGDGMKEVAARLQKSNAFLGSIISQPEIANDDMLKSKFEEMHTATNNVQLFVIELFRMAEQAAKRATELNPSLSLITADDINLLLNKDKRYADFAGILAVSASPAEIFPKFSQIVGYIKSKIIQTINSIQNAEVKKNLLNKANSSGM